MTTPGATDRTTPTGSTSSTSDDTSVRGLWALGNLRLIRLDADSLPVDSAPDHLTQAYALSDFEAPPPPRDSALLPSSGSRLGGDEVVLEGLHLRDTESVLIGGNPADLVVQDDYSLLVTIPPIGPLIPAWTRDSIPVDMVVTTPWGGDLAQGAFRYRP